MGVPTGGSGPANLAFWYRADSDVYKDAGLTLVSDGDTAQQWRDQSGNNRHLNQATAAKRPLYRVNRHYGRPSLTFDGIDDFLQATAFTFNQPLDVYIVYRPISWKANAVIWAGNAAAGVYYAQKNVSPITRVYAGSNGSDYSGPSIGQWAIIETGIDNSGGYTRSGVGSLKSVIMDGLFGTNANSTGAIGANNPGNFTLGADADGTNPANFEVLEILGYSAALSQANSDVVRFYAGAGTGLFDRDGLVEGIVSDLIYYPSFVESIVPDLLYYPSLIESISDAEIVAVPTEIPIPPFLRPIDTVAATCVAWAHENRLFLSYGGKTYVRDLILPQAGWADAGYGYVNSVVTASRFNHPYMAFLSANMDPAGYGDRSQFVSFSHRSLSPTAYFAETSPSKIVRFRPFGNNELKQAVRFRCWGKVESIRAGQIGTLIATSDVGCREEVPIFLNAYTPGLIIEHKFSTSMIGEEITVDLIFNKNVISAEFSQSKLEYLPLV